MKKVIALILALAMVFALAACGGKKNEGGNTAAKWPNGEIDFFYPYSESSPTAVNAGVMNDWLTEKTGVRVTPTYDSTGNGWKLAQDLLAAPADGQTLMVIGGDALEAIQQGIWQEDITDESKFTVVTGFVQPNPSVGCMIITQKDSPYNTWAELEAYAKAHPDEVKVADRAGSVMTIKLKSLFNQTGLSKYVHWSPAKGSSEVKTGIDPANGTFNIAIFEESQAVAYLQQPEKYKAIINCRPDNDFSYYPEGTKGLDLIKAVPTLADVFGAEKAVQYNVPNTSAIICKAGTPAEIVAQIKAAVDALGDVEKSTDEKSWYVRQRVSGGTSKYYTWPAADILNEWKRLTPIVKEIVNMK